MATRNAFDGIQNVLYLQPESFSASWTGYMDGDEPVESLSLQIMARIQPQDSMLADFTKRFSRGEIRVVPRGEEERRRSSVMKVSDKGSLFFVLLANSACAASMANLLARTSYHYFTIEIRPQSLLWKWDEKGELVIEKWNIQAVVPSGRRVNIEAS